MNLKKIISLSLIISLTFQPIFSSEAGTEAQANAESSDPATSGDAKKAEKDSGAIKCHKKVLTDLGLEGVDQAADIDLELCPWVESSCCTVKDQLLIHETWTTAKVQENLKAKFDFHTKVGDSISLVDAGVYA